MKFRIDETQSAKKKVREFLHELPDNDISITDEELDELIHVANEADDHEHNVGYFSERINHHHGGREKAFHKHWKSENFPSKGINFGYGILQDLFINTDKKDTLQSKRAMFWVQKRERRIVATVIQWLGTNCGWCFLTDVINSCGYEVVKKEDREKFFKELYELRQYKEKVKQMFK